MRIPEPNNSISALIDKHHERQEQGQRGHLGASLLGHPCDRYLWLSFRWAVIPKFPGRILRLFRRGHMEEATLVSDLRAIGIDLRHTGRDQKRVDFGAHVSGSIDAIAESGVPESPNKRHIVEFKTHSLKSFADLEKHGVQKSKPQHYAQMQVYMAGTGIDRALYVLFSIFSIFYVDKNASAKALGNLVAIVPIFMLLAYMFSAFTFWTFNVFDIRRSKIIVINHKYVLVNKNIKNLIIILINSF